MEDRVFVFFVACAGLVGRGACASDIIVVGVEFFFAAETANSLSTSPLRIRTAQIAGVERTH